jgi:L-fucose dehydrogenase
MDLELKGKVIIVTGGASGIGEAIVRTLAIEGAVPVILDRKPVDDCSSLLAELEIEHKDDLYFEIDITDEQRIHQAVDATFGCFERIDGIVNNAGVNDRIGLAALPGDFRQSLECNLVPAFSLLHHSLPYLRKSPGASVVNIGSKVSVTGQGGTSGYAAAKGGLAALTREWALDLCYDNIRVNAVLPAEVWTPMYDEWLGFRPDAQVRRDEIEARIPLGRRMTEAREIADTAVFLLSGRSSHTTGQLLHVDGGYTHLDRAFPSQQ